MDVILASRMVGPRGKVFGVDFAPRMIERAELAVAEAGLRDRDIELSVAELESSRLPESFSDVVISNCVINLCSDKDAVYKEAFRVLRPGGRLAISDVVLTEKIDRHLQARFQSTWSGCLGGAIPEKDYTRVLRKAGFTEIQIVKRHTLTPGELAAMSCCPGGDFTPAPAGEDLAVVQGKVTSIKFTALKPA